MPLYAPGTPTGNIAGALQGQQMYGSMAAPLGQQLAGSMGSAPPGQQLAGSMGSAPMTQAQQQFLAGVGPGAMSQANNPFGNIGQAAAANPAPGQLGTPTSIGASAAAHPPMPSGFSVHPSIGALAPGITPQQSWGLHNAYAALGTPAAHAASQGRQNQPAGPVHPSFMRR
jgi:hypothetical protein